MMQGLKHRQKVKSPQKEEEETKFPLAFHAEGKNPNQASDIRNDAIALHKTNIK